jgi:hypothetical protein
LSLEHEWCMYAPLKRRMPVRARLDSPKFEAIMFIMSKDEVHSAVRVWPANVKQPIDRDAQIWLMKTASWRHKATMKRIKRLLEDERKGQ